MEEPDGWVRLHRLSPLLDAGKFVIGAFFASMQLWGDQVLRSSSAAGVLLQVGAALSAGALLVLAYVAVAWRFRMYRVTADLVEVKSGILFRSYRHLPFERIESIDTAQPIVPRLLGLAEVRIEAISAKGSELRLRYLELREAERLRAELAARRRAGSREARAGEPSDALDAPVAPDALILAVPSRELLLGYVVLPVVTGAALFVPIVIAVGLVAGWAEALATVAAGALGTATVVVPSLVIRLERLWGFRLEGSDDALVVHRGLLNLNTQRIATGRIQALRIDQPPLWRLYGRYRIVVDVAGYRGSGEQAAASANLLPIAPDEVVRYLVARLEVRTDLATLPFRPVPDRARWRSLRWRSFSVAWTDTEAVVRSGVLWRRTAVVPHRRLQSARVTQGPWQRRLGLASLRLDTAGSRVTAVAAHCDTRYAVELADRSASAARHSMQSASSSSRTHRASPPDSNSTGWGGAPSTPS